MAVSVPVAALLCAVGAAPSSTSRELCPSSCAGGGFNLACTFFPEPDEGFHEQWYIEAVRACEVWNQGYTGDGVVVGVLDYGILQAHPDLTAQIEAAEPRGCSEREPETLPPLAVRDWHGTNIGGIIAADAGNETGLCSNTTGIAFGARLAEVFLWNGSGFDDAELAHALRFGNDCIHVKVNSYDISGFSPRHAYLHPSVRASLEDGVLAGRSALGVVSVFSAGNEGHPQTLARTDHDELVSNRRNIAVGAITPGYTRWIGSEGGSSLLCTAPGDLMFTTGRRTQFSLDPDYNCPTGTSYSAPVVGAIVALMLEANPDLAWRDVMDAIALTAVTIDDNPDDTTDWRTNSAGLDHSYGHGHGLIDAPSAVAHVIDPAWVPLLPEREIHAPIATGGVTLGPGGSRTLAIETIGAMRLEHVELLIDIDASGRRGIGALEIDIARAETARRIGSPLSAPTRSVFALARDDPAAAYRNPYDGSPAVFTSVRHWGESAGATWSVRVRNTSTSDDAVVATWNTAELRFYGTPLCIADWDMDTMPSTQQDWNLYNAWWTASDSRADLNGDRKVNGQDMGIFVTEFERGCE